jgi:uncharacterized membrane protein YeiB
LILQNSIISFEQWIMKEMLSETLVNSKLIASTSNSRIVGYDLARALSFLGMLLIDFWALTDDSKTGIKFLVPTLGFIQGRAAATFVVLAGVGLALLSRNAYLNNDAAGMRANHYKILRRALFLYIIGLLNTLIWPEDILHFYAVYFAIGSYLISISNRRLLVLTVAPIVAFSLLMIMVNFDRGWDSEAISFTDVRKLPGMIYHIFFNGLYPVFPWAAFLIMGLWLGRQDLTEHILRRKILLAGIGALVFAECLSWTVSHMATSGLGNPDLKDFLMWLAIDPWEPMPLFPISAVGTALIVIILSMMLAEKCSNARWLFPFMALGQLTLTLYVAHIIFGLTVLKAMESFGMEPLLFPVWATVLFYMGALLFAYHWKRRFQKGPLEWLMRLFLVQPIPWKALIIKNGT